MRRSVFFPGFVLLTVGACSGFWGPEPYAHTVRSGETVYSIAFHYGLDYRELARWNGLDNRYLIRPGQELVLYEPSAGGSGSTGAKASGASSTRSKPPVPSTAARHPVPDWIWPTDGAIVARFEGSAGGNKGINISGKTGQSVRVAAAGRVVYSGSGLIGYGPLIIVKHNNTYLSAYGHNRKLLVREGDQLKAGQRIAEMGEGAGNRPVLHFEIRRNGQPVDPMKYLPRR